MQKPSIALSEFSLILYTKLYILIENPGGIYGCYFHINNDNLGLNSKPGIRCVCFHSETCHGNEGKEERQWGCFSH